MSAPTLFGIETEYAFVVETREESGEVVHAVNLIGDLFRLARERVVHLPGIHSSGIFLADGARFYIDAGAHPEFCTPECMTPREGVRWLIAGERILAELVEHLGKSRPAVRPALFRCNVDYSGTGSTWGCHESYSIQARQEAIAPRLVPHLVSRIVLTGAGGFDNGEGSGGFLLSPRVPHFHDAASFVPASPRALIHSRCEPLSHGGYDRLHLMCGESLCSQVANYLKLGCTALVVRLAEWSGAIPEEIAFAHPLEAMRVYASDPSCRATARLSDGRQLTAIEVQRLYLEAVETQVQRGTLPDWAPELCAEWRGMLDRLEQGPEAVATRLDWAIKYALFSERTSSAPRAWRAQRIELAEIDTRFGQLGTGSIFGALDAAGALDHALADLGSIEDAMVSPPPGGRAEARGRAVAEVAAAGSGSAEWDRVVDEDGERVLLLPDPFDHAPEWSAGAIPRDFTPPRARSRLEQGRSLLQAGFEQYAQIELEASIESLQTATRLLRRDTDRRCEARFWLACALQDLGRCTESRRVLRPALIDPREGTSLDTAIRVWSRMAVALLEQPAPLERIERHLLETEALSQRSGSGQGRSRHSQLRARFLGMQGRHTEAIDLLERAITEREDDRIGFSDSAYYRWLIRFCLRAGDLDRARAVIGDRLTGPRPAWRTGRNRYLESEIALYLLCAGEAEQAFELAMELVLRGAGGISHRYHIGAACVLVHASLATGRLESARMALIETLSWANTEVLELRYEQRLAHLAYLEACEAEPDEDGQRRFVGLDRASISSVRRSASRLARTLDTRLGTGFWSEHLASGRLL